jgi:hypothetical protein
MLGIFVVELLESVILIGWEIMPRLRDIWHIEHPNSTYLIIAGNTVDTATCKRILSG